MKLIGGLRQDELPIDQPSTTWRDGQNIVVRKFNQAVSNEDGADDITPTAGVGTQNYPVNKICIGKIEMSTEVVLFFATTNPADSEIGYIDENKKYITIIKEDPSNIVLNFNQNFPIQGTFENKYNNNRIISWGDRGHNPPRILNIDCLPFRVDSTTFLINPADINKARNLINLFPSFETPLVVTDGINVKDSQGALSTGVYYPIVCYELQDGTVVSWSKVYNGIPIYSDSQFQKFELVGGDVAGTPTNKSIEINFSNVDTNYSYLRIGYLYVNNGVTTAYYVNKFYITSSNLTVQIYGNEESLETITLDEVLIPNAIYDGNFTMTNLLGKLMLGNVTQPDEINLQPYANEIKVQWIREKDIAITGLVKNVTSGGSVTSYGSYKDGSVVFFDKNFKSGECYALYIAAKLKAGGIYTKAFHIPGRSTNDSIDHDRDNQNTSSTPDDWSEVAGGIGVNLPKFRCFDTSKQAPGLDSGDMGYWENEDELYPVDPNNPSNIHPDYANIKGNNGNTFISTTPVPATGSVEAYPNGDRKVRHHVFPDLWTLKSYAKASGGTHDFLNFSASTVSKKKIRLTGSDMGNPVTEEYNFFYNGVTVLDNTTPLAFGTPLPNVSYGGNRQGERISSFAEAGVLNIKAVFNSAPFPASGGMFPSYPASWNAGGGDIVNWFSIRKNGVNIPNLQFSIDISATGSHIVQLNPATGGLYAGTTSFPSSTATIQVPVQPGDYIDIEQHTTVFGTGGFGTPSPTLIGDYETAWGGHVDIEFIGANIKSRPLGIMLSNIQIPQDVADKIDTIEIFYGKRDNTNIRIVAQDMVKEARFHNFDLISTKAISNIDYLKPQLNYDGGTSSQLQDTISGVGNTITEHQFTGSYIPKVKKFLYVGQNTLLNIGGGLVVNNTNKADSIYIDAGYGVTVTNPQAVLAPYQALNTLYDLCLYKTNMYFPFNKQDLTYTGYGFKIDKSTPATNTYTGKTVWIQPSVKLYGGDTYINGFGFIDSTTSNVPFYLACESISNIGLRYQDIAATKYYYPKNSNPTPSYYAYNKDYNAINNFNQLDIYYIDDTDCNTKPITVFPYRIPYSITDANESKLLNWRTFKINSYYEMPKSKGVIYNLLGSNRTLYIHMQYSLFIASIKDKLATVGSETYLGFSDIFDRPPEEVLTTNEGFAGNQSQFATILCRLGYCFIDRQAKRVFICTNGRLKEISNEGLFNFFKAHGQQTIIDTDNPYIACGYTMTFDEQLERLILVKNVPDTIGNTPFDYSFTLSYSPRLNNGEGGWVSFHTYRPSAIFYNREGLFAIDNTRNKFFKHNSSNNKSTFYDGLVKDSYVDVVFNENPKTSKHFDNVNWISTSENNLGNSFSETITHLIAYNENQCSGLIDIKAQKGLWYGKDARNVQGNWNFNNFRDLVINPNNPILDDRRQVINTNIKINKAWYEKSRFISKFLAFRLIYNNISQRNLHISEVDSNYNKADR